MKEIGTRGNIFTLGCMYWNRVNKYMTMMGSVTDAQIFSRNLQDEEMIAYTECSKKVNFVILGSNENENYSAFKYKVTLEKIQLLSTMSHFHRGNINN